MIATRKSELRRQMRGQRLMLSETEVESRSTAIVNRLVQLPAFAEARTILTYVSRGNEVATHALIQLLLRTGREVGVPMFDAVDNVYRAALIRGFPDDMRTGKLQILEPNPTTARVVDIAHFAALVVPGVAFDSRGARLGRGKGYYDRLLEGATGAKIALAYDFEVLTEIPVAEHDVHMDFIVTETKVVECKRD